MRHVSTVLLTGVFLLGVGSMASAIDLGMDKGKVKDAETTLKEMTSEGEDKVKETKGEAKEESMAEKIQSKSKEKINEKIDDVQGNMIGK